MPYIVPGVKYNKEHPSSCLGVCILLEMIDCAVCSHFRSMERALKELCTGHQERH